MVQQLSLRIHSVTCVDETNGQWVERLGNDEIWLGGYAIAANGATTPIMPFEVYAGFDDGDMKVFDPPRVFHSFTLAVPSVPHEVGLGLVLVEKDNGGMREAITAMAGLVQGRIQPLLVPRSGAAAATISLEPLKAALISTAKVIASDIMRRVVAAYNDDIFLPQHATLRVSGNNLSFSGSPTSARKRVRFQGHDGIYDLVYDWQVTRPVVNG